MNDRDAGRWWARDAWLAAAVALVVRLAFVAWAAGRFPPSGDGEFYDLLAKRLAHGEGYTWLWPDGAITSVAHYPVGYPALVAAGYALFGAHPAVAMGINAVFGAAMAFAVHVLARPCATRRGALAAALVIALHPALVPYTGALMTEGVAAALLTVALAAVRARADRPWVGWLLAGLAMGAATLVRPQCLALAPLVGLLAPASFPAWGARLRAAVAVTAVALACCGPWTVRNCVAMHQCALVSVNGGWNLAIGTQTTTGAWQAIDVPPECRTVWDEAAKDACFARAARATIARDPLDWLARAPAKVAVTLDYFGAAPWYLHLANPAAFGERAKWILGAVETLLCRLTLLLALFTVARTIGPAQWTRIVLCAVGGLFACLTDGWVAYVLLSVAILGFGPRRLLTGPVVVPFTAVVLLGTVATHAVFFGAGRYGLVVVPFVSVLAFARAIRATPAPPPARESRSSSKSSGTLSFPSAT